MAISKLKSNEINPITDLNDLPTANVASPGFYLNAGVVTKGSA